ncbi:MAG: hypothetical protein U0271_35030 [Polyangiaceae bacterium]
MAARDLFSPELKRAVAEGVARVEETTSAEVVVAVHKRSAVYREAFWLSGALLAFVALLLLLFLPQPFTVETMPIDVCVAFLLGAAAAWRIPQLERLFASRASMRAAVELAAHTELFRGGVSQTRRRTGVLVYVSVLESRAHVVADLGLTGVEELDAWKTAVRLIERAAARRDSGALVAGLAALAGPLAARCPKTHDDIDELPNEPRHAN